MLYLIPKMVAGGAERVDLDILEGLDDKKFRKILVVEFEADHQWQSKFAAEVESVHFCSDFSGAGPQIDAFLDDLLIARNIDIVLNRNTFCGYRAFRRWYSVETNVRFADLIHFHNSGDDWLDYSESFPRCMHRRYVSTYGLKNYAITKYGKQNESLRVIQCGVEPSEWDPGKIEKGALRRTMKLANDKLIVGFVGRFEDQKNPLKWLEVAGQINKRNREICFAMIGDGVLLDRCIEYAREHRLASVVHFLGYCDDLPHLIVDLDCLLLVSRYEGLPIVALNAMSLGVPVVSTDVGSIHECVTKDVGRILPVNTSVSNIADGVETLLLSRREDNSLPQRCRQRVLENFSKKKMQESYVSEFEEMYREINREERVLQHHTKSC